MFPPVRVTFSLSSSGADASQLNPRDKYQVLMDILPYDNKRYRYAYHKSSWTQAGKADPPSPTKLFLHPDGPFTLEQLKRQVISFEKIKLTNNDANRHGYVSTCLAHWPLWPAGCAHRRRVRARTRIWATGAVPSGEASVAGRCVR